MSTPPPNHTQTPNDLFDAWLPEMSGSELKVVLVIIRHTFGWHQDKAKLSLSFLQKATGLSRQAVIDAADAAKARGIIDREPHGNSFLYFLLIHEGDQEVVQKVDQSTNQTTNGLKSRPEIVQKVDTKKEKKERKEKTLSVSPNGDKSAPEPRERTDLEKAVIEGSWGIPGDSPLSDGFLVGQIVHWLKKEAPEETAQEVKRFYRWYAKHYPDISAPRKLETFEMNYRSFMAARAKHLEHGSEDSTVPTMRRPEALDEPVPTPEQRAAALAKLEELNRGRE